MNASERGGPNVGGVLRTVDPQAEPQLRIVARSARPTFNADFKIRFRNFEWQYLDPSS